VPFPLGEVIHDELPGVKDVTHFYTFDNIVMRRPDSDKNFGRNGNVIFADAGFFRFFEREWLVGNPAHAMEEPNTIRGSR
jgi:putative ABC transport system permease protein